MVIIKKKLTAAAVISFTILGLCACGKETAGVSTVSVDKEGKVESVLYDTFDKDYYSLGKGFENTRGNHVCRSYT